MEVVPSVSRSFSGHDHGWYFSAPFLDQASSSRVNGIFDLDLAKRDAKALLKERCLRSGISSQNGTDVVNFFNFFGFI